MAQTKSKMTIDEILAGIDERIELLGTIKAAVRYAFTDRYEETDEVHEETPAPRPTRRRKRSKHYTPRGQNKALLTQALQTAGPMSTDGVYEWLKANGWQTTSANPRYLVAVTLRQMQKAGTLVRDAADGFWSLAPATHTTETTPAQQVA